LTARYDPAEGIAVGKRATLKLAREKAAQQNIVKASHRTPPPEKP
jgi:hypothetical protein